MEKKIEIIKQYKDPIIAAFDTLLDATYNMTESFLDEKGNLKPDFTPDVAAENFVKELAADAKDYEKLRRKIIDNDFNLSSFEVQTIAIVLNFVKAKWEKQIKYLNKASVEISCLIEDLQK